MTTTKLEFTTPTRKAREDRPIPVELCGHELTLHRPKDATLYFASQITAATASDGDRAMAILQVIDGILDPQTRKAFWDWAIRGEVNLAAVMEMIGEALNRWQHWDAKNTAPIRIAFTPSAWQPQPVEVVNEDLGIAWTCTPPSDLIVGCVAASLATGANEGQQAWGIGVFLDATLSPVDRMTVQRRLMSYDGDLELEDIAEIVTALLEKWRPPTNRAERRAKDKKPATVRQVPGKGTASRVRKAATTRGTRAR